MRRKMFHNQAISHTIVTTTMTTLFLRTTTKDDVEGSSGVETAPATSKWGVRACVRAAEAAGEAPEAREGAGGSSQPARRPTPPPHSPTVTTSSAGKRSERPLDIRQPHFLVRDRFFAVRACSRAGGGPVSAAGVGYWCAAGMDKCESCNCIAVLGKNGGGNCVARTPRASLVT